MIKPRIESRTKDEIFIEIISKCRNLSTEKIIQWLRKHGNPNGNDYRKFVILILKKENTVYADKGVLQTIITNFTVDSRIWPTYIVCHFINIIINPTKILTNSKLRRINKKIPEYFISQVK